jgi:hypothetical protein
MGSLKVPIQCRTCGVELAMSNGRSRQLSVRKEAVMLDPLHTVPMAAICPGIRSDSSSKGYTSAQFRPILA